MEAKEYKFVVEGFKGSTKETEKKEKTLKIVFSVFSYVFLTIFALIMMFPFYWMVLTSLKQEVFDGRFLGLTNDFFISFSNPSFQILLVNHFLFHIGNFELMVALNL